MDYLSIIKQELHKDGSMMENIDVKLVKKHYWSLCKIAVKESEKPSFRYIKKSEISDLYSLYLLILTSECTEFEYIKKFIILSETPDYFKLFHEAITIKPKAIRYVLMYRDELPKLEINKLIKYALKSDIKVIIYLENEDITSNILTALISYYRS